ncbi:MAG: DUF202 domain-containing protein [Candidatus Zixiibacteriota bacterium]|nr:MAG: DUF202 domain-containing protein [candidate division Zixibacteria bacterium]
MDIKGRRSYVTDNTYSSFKKRDMLLRDHLAVDRTTLSNQNTFLAYIRTALTLFVAGVTFIRFFGSTAIEIIGWCFVPIGVFTFVTGLIRYNRLRITLRKIERS